MTGLDKAIDHFGGAGKGGQARLAEALDVGPMTISHWKSRGIPTDRCADIERVTGGAVTRAELKPEIFGSVVAA
jgi:DNA-binding transcriptional regulator YdaS (Cro superfamily)